MKLSVPDVERDHAGGTALEEHVGEPSRGGADVETVETGRLDMERIQGVIELLAAARDEPRAALDLELGVGLHLLSCLRMTGDAAGEDQGLSLRARLGEPTLDQ